MSATLPPGTPVLVRGPQGAWHPGVVVRVNPPPCCGSAYSPYVVQLTPPIAVAGPFGPMSVAELEGDENTVRRRR